MIWVGKCGVQRARGSGLTWLSFESGGALGSGQTRDAREADLALGSSLSEESLQTWNTAGGLDGVPCAALRRPSAHGLHGHVTGHPESTPAFASAHFCWDCGVSLRMAPGW